MTKTLADAQALYEDHLRQAGKAHATIIAYTKDIEQLIDFVGKKGKTQVDEVNQTDIEEFKEQLKKNRYTGKSVSRKINSIKSFFRFLIVRAYRGQSSR